MEWGKCFILSLNLPVFKTSTPALISSNETCCFWFCFSVGKTGNLFVTTVLKFPVMYLCFLPSRWALMDSFTFEKPVLENVRAFSLISSPLVHSLSVTPIIEILHLWVWFSNSVLYFFLFCRGGGRGNFLNSLTLMFSLSFLPWSYFYFPRVLSCFLLLSL